MGTGRNPRTRPPAQPAKARADRPASAEVLALIRAGAWQPAEAALSARLRRRPHDVEALNLLGVAATGRGDLGRAEQALQRALALQPGLAAAHYNLGRLRARQGRPDAAIACYQRAIDAEPGFALAHNNLGNLLRERDELAAALDCYRRAVAADPNLALAHRNLGNVELDLGRPEAAIAAYQQALLLNWDDPGAHHHLGLALARRGELEAAAAAFGHAIGLRPDHVQAHDQLGVVRLRQRQSGAALAAHERALELDPDYAPAHVHRGNALWRLGRVGEAEQAYRRALSLRPDDAEAHCNLGLLHRRRGELEPALASFREALRHDGGLAAAHAGLADGLRQQARPGEAEAACRRALELDPRCADAYVTLGNLCADRDRLGDAAACYRRALELEPDRAAVHGNLGKVLQGLGQIEAAAAALRRALELDPAYTAAIAPLVHVLQHLCAWPEMAALEPRLDALIDHALASGSRVDEQPFAQLTRCPDPGRNLAVARSWSEAIARRTRPLELTFADRRQQRARIRLGYLSSDFRDHPVASHFLRALDRHDRGRFEVTGYGHGPDDGSAGRRQAIAACERFVDLDPLSDAEAARRIHADAIDILVDLTGYMRGHRLGICALRPAPVQATYFGFPGSTGAGFFDYLIADPVVAPAGHARHYSERLVHLPGSYQPNDYAGLALPPAPLRAEHGLPEAALVLASFNQPCKIEPSLFDVWMRVLAAVPDAVLWLYAGSPTALANLRREAGRRGVDPGRLIAAEHLPLPAHLARLALADLVLDTRIYGGGCTTSNALWAGVPVLTLRGEHFAARMGASILGALGLGELIATSPDAYAALALQLARDRGRLRALRARLAELRTTSPVFDAAPLIRDLEHAYERIWRLWLAGQPPRSLTPERADAVPLTGRV